MVIIHIATLLKIKVKLLINYNKLDKDFPALKSCLKCNLYSPNFT